MGRLLGEMSGLSVIISRFSFGRQNRYCVELVKVKIVKISKENKVKESQNNKFYFTLWR